MKNSKKLKLFNERFDRAIKIADSVQKSSDNGLGVEELSDRIVECEVNRIFIEKVYPELGKVIDIRIRVISAMVLAITSSRQIGMTDEVTKETIWQSLQNHHNNLN